MSDWIKLPRSIFDWDWYDKAETLSLYLYLLNNAKEKDVEHNGYVEHRGQFVTSLGKLSTVLGVGKQIVRTSLLRLTKMKLIEVSTEKLYSVVTICNYDSFIINEIGEQETEAKKEELKPTEINDNEKKPKKTKEEIVTATEKRKEKFYQELVPYVATYGKDMVRKFFDYWSETNKTKIRMRFETEKTWDLNLRLQTWARRNKEFGTKQSDTALHGSENKNYNEGGW